jgi:hypothetical protein
MPDHPVPKKKEEHKRKYMKIRTMRSFLFLLLVCLVITGTATAAASTVTETARTPMAMLSQACTNDAYAGLPGGTGLAVVEVSGHGDTTIDGKSVEPVGVGKYKGYDAIWYGTSEGSHVVFITRQGYFSYTLTMPVCSGKVSYVYYDQAAYLSAGPSRPPTTTTTTVVPNTTEFAGQSADYGALKAALGTTNPSNTPGSLSVTTDPAGATIFIDGVQQGISPATIPGLAPGSHTLLLKLDGYQDLSLPVVISAGKTQNYASALLKSGTAPDTAAGPGTTKKSSAPGPESVAATCAVGALFLFRKSHS